MDQYALDKYRNLVLLSHSGAGKTSLSETMLFNAGVINRMGRVEDGSTVSDHDPDEVKRQISINLSLLPFEWQKTKINLVDTPGYSDFVSEVKAAMRVCEGAIVMVCAASGVEVGTEQTWAYSEEANLPRFIFVNKMDRENADFNRTLEQLQAKFGLKCVPLQIPIGAQDKFEGVINLLNMKSYTGNPPSEGEIPGALQDQANVMKEKLVEAVAEIDDSLIEKYLGGEELSPEEINSGLREGIATGKIIPVLAGSVSKNIGITALMDAVCEYLPSPAEGKIMLAGDGQTIEPSQDGSLAALVFKTTADPYVGKLTYFRVYTGAIDSNSQVWNGNQDGVERVGQLYMIRGKNQEPVAQVKAGDIGAVAKLNVTNTGDTLSVKEKPVKIAPITFPPPLYSQAVHPKTKGDLDKLGSSLTRLSEEDPTLHVDRDSDTGETIISGIGETQLDVAAEKMQRKFGVNVELEMPSVPYKETITASTNAEYKHKKQTGGHGQYGHVLLTLEPLSRGGGSEFVDKIVGGAIPRNYIPSVEKGVNEAMGEGVLGHFPVTDIRAIVYDGSFHPVDSSDICFKIAGSQAVKKGLAQGQPILLEPIVNVKITVPEEFTGEVVGDLNTKRARVLGMNPEGSTNTIDAQAPLAEMQRYAIDMKSMTQGRGSFTIEFSHYEEVPAQITQRIVQEKQEAAKA